MKERIKSLNKIKRAYETGQLGFQKDANTCINYDSESDIRCNMAMLVAKNKQIYDGYGRITRPFLDCFSYNISTAINDLSVEYQEGLSCDELVILQGLHDEIVSNNPAKSITKSIEEFESFLYGLDDVEFCEQ